jgi:hypothetical protein
MAAMVTVALDLILADFPPQELIKIGIEGMENAACEERTEPSNSSRTVLREMTTESRKCSKPSDPPRDTMMFAAKRQNRGPLQRPSDKTLALA